MRVDCTVDCRRRWVLRGAAVAGIGLFSARSAWADDTGFDAKSLAELWQILGGRPVLHKGIELTLPDVAENGAVVAISVHSQLADTQEILIVSAANPNPLVARLSIPPGTEPLIATRIKMAQSGTVYAVVRADDKWVYACHDTQVIVGACGG